MCPGTQEELGLSLKGFVEKKQKRKSIVTFVIVDLFSAEVHHVRM